MGCIFSNASVVPSSNFVDFIHCASRICLGQNVKAKRWRQICPLKTNIFTLNAPISTNEVSMFNLAIEVCFENHFGLIRAIFLSLGSSKSVYFFGTPGNSLGVMNFQKWELFSGSPVIYNIRLRG